MKQGAKLARLMVSPVNREVDMQVHLSVYIAFVGAHYGHMDKGRVFLVLRALIYEVDRIVGEADPYL